MQLTAPALTVADIKIQVPAVYDDGYIDCMLDICRRHDIKAVICLNDLELPILSRDKARFEAIGVKVIVSDPEIIDICFDKYRTARYVESIGLDTPMTFVNYGEAVAAIRSGKLKFPIVLKPRWGSGSIGIEFVNDMEELEETYGMLIKKVKNRSSPTHPKGDEFILIQQKIDGQEYGLDVMNDLSGRHRAVSVKRNLPCGPERQTKPRLLIMPISVPLDTLGKSLSHIGNLDVDVFEKDGKYFVLELNPRFGGGFPFSYEAGANLPGAIIEWLKGNDVDDDMLQPNYNETYAKCDYLVKI